MANVTYPYNLSNITGSDPSYVFFQLNYMSEFWVAYASLIIIFAVVFLYSMYKQDKKSIYSSLLSASAITWGFSLIMVLWRVNGMTFIPFQTSLTLFFIMVLAFLARKMVKE